jgi:hypothetical protein
MHGSVHRENISMIDGGASALTNAKRFVLDGKADDEIFALRERLTHA